MASERKAIRYWPCADHTPHEDHTWGWPAKKCEGLRADEVKDLKMATKMARLFHEEELQRRQENEALWANEHQLHLVLTWDVLPEHQRQEKIEAMLQVFRWVNSQISGAGTKYQHGQESPMVAPPHLVQPQPQHRRPSHTRSW